MARGPTEVFDKISNEDANLVKILEAQIDKEMLSWRTVGPQTVCLPYVNPVVSAELIRIYTAAGWHQLKIESRAHLNESYSTMYFAMKDYK